jgi:hypothetical protein
VFVPPATREEAERLWQGFVEAVDQIALRGMMAEEEEQRVKAGGWARFWDAAAEAARESRRPRRRRRFRR